MKQIIFCTGNHEKFEGAKEVCDQYAVELVQRDQNIDEIQDENPQNVAVDKAQKAFQALKQPLIITDNSWSFHGLGGFPGVYMHSINHWFTAEDFLRLTAGLKDKTVTYTTYLIYVDGEQQKIFTSKHNGHILDESRGESAFSAHKILTLDGDNRLSIAEVWEHSNKKSEREVAQIWHEFAVWAASNTKVTEA